MATAIVVMFLTSPIYLKIQNLTAMSTGLKIARSLDAIMNGVFSQYSIDEIAKKLEAAQMPLAV